MIGQSKLMSWIEVAVNIAVGYTISVMMTHYIFNVSFIANLWISGLFTIVSILRSYLLRRVFNKLMLRGTQ